jgi:hypothetical protein
MEANTEWLSLGEDYEGDPDRTLAKFLINLDGLKHVPNGRCVPDATPGSGHTFVIECGCNGVH